LSVYSIPKHLVCTPH